MAYGKEKTIFVYADWDGASPALMGMLYCTDSRKGEVFSFEYEESWLKSQKKAVFFDPDLELYSGRQYTPMDKALFGLFSDSCPDRWGRLLMKRREAIRAKKEERRANVLNESDYLLGVYDETRMGALRFSLEEGGAFLSADQSLAAPPWTTLRALESASLSFEKEDGEEEKWLKQLLAPGSSLGGARPKASVQAPDGSLWIAKFPSKHDEWNSGAWEMVVHDLAAKCHLNVPEACLETFSKNGSTFLVKRFDRDGGKRIHFSSAMTLLGKTDGAEDVSYLDLVSFIRAYGAEPEADLRELWRRLVFFIAVSNTDDHLRNHGFLLTDNGWKLSPAYDVNPNIYGNSLSLLIDQQNDALDFQLALDTARYYEIPEKEAREMISEIQEIVKGSWRKVAAGYGFSRGAIEKMGGAFERSGEY